MTYICSNKKHLLKEIWILGRKRTKIMRKLFYLLALLGLVSCAEDFDSKLDDNLRRSVQQASPKHTSFSFSMPQRDDFLGIPQDFNNPLSKEKVELGKLLFHETSFGTDGKFDELESTFSCASCHHAGAGFQAGVSQGVGDGGIGFGNAGEGRIIMDGATIADIDVQPVRTPSAMNLAYQTNLLWNGQFGATNFNEEFAGTYDPDKPTATNDLGFEGLATQAIAGLTVHRHDFSEESIIQHGYKELFDVAFPGMAKEQKYSNVAAGMAIAAYERILLSNKAPFQEWLRGDKQSMTDNQKQGALLFFGKAKCIDCHSGPSLANMEFHGIGMNDFSPEEIFFLNEEEMVGASLGRGGFTKNTADEYKFKVPQLYNLLDSPFFGHGSSFTNVRDVIRYKNEAIPENPDVPEGQLADGFKPLGLSETEIDQLTDFIENGLYDRFLDRYVPSELPSGKCFPNSDEMSMSDLGCGG